jgi:hypothetical protein
MRIGFVSLYSWRPHVEHLHYLASLVKKAGHNVEFLTCDADLPTCYTRELRNIRPDWQECLICRSGGIRSYESKNVFSIGSFAAKKVLLPNESEIWGLSSASSIGRFESEADFDSPAFHNLVNRIQPVVDKAYTAAYNWIEQRRLDAVVVFNGRMDATRAIFEAAKIKRLPVATLERTWFGDGIQILPGEHCLGLESVHRLVKCWSEKPLTKEQAIIAAGHISSRFLRSNHNEWRIYNANAEELPWPESGKRKVLLLPGSLNELWGHSQWGSNWRHPLEAYDALIDHLALEPKDIVLRAHPNWGEKIGKADGNMVETYYARWAKERGLKMIASTENISTIKLIEYSEVVVVASGSGALEAGALGKQVIGIAGANYQNAGIREEACSYEQLKSIKLWRDYPKEVQISMAQRVRQNTLRFAYTMIHRIPQYVDYVKCLTPTRYVYKPRANASRLLDLLITGELVADDPVFAENNLGEAQILDAMIDKRWSDLANKQKLSEIYKPIRRRFPYAGLDRIRSLMRHGDR